MGKLGGSLAGMAIVLPLIAVAATPGRSAGCATAALTITNADNGKTICVRPGTRIQVELPDSTQPPQHTGPLEPRSPTAFTALSGGEGTISAVISPCAPPSGAMHCMVLELFKVQVEIHAAA
jgi:hypothetical protein